jgi:hypothetical protein
MIIIFSPSRKISGRYIACRYAAAIISKFFQLTTRNCAVISHSISDKLFTFGAVSTKKQTAVGELKYKTGPVTRHHAMNTYGEWR